MSLKKDAGLGKNEPFLIDQVTLICNGCRGERVFELEKRIESAYELITWMNIYPTACSCGAATCDIKCRMVRLS